MLAGEERVLQAVHAELQAQLQQLVAGRPRVEATHSTMGAADARAHGDPPQHRQGEF